MSQASDYLENQLINHVLRNTTFTPPTTVAVALFTSSPTDTGTAGVEIHTSGGYARQSASFGPALTGSTGNIATLTFGPASTNWGSVTHFALFDNSTSGSGNMLVWNSLTSPVTISSSDSLQFSSGTLQVTVL
jgi:hypothetical protein